MSEVYTAIPLLPSVSIPTPQVRVRPLSMDAIRGRNTKTFFTILLVLIVLAGLIAFLVLQLHKAKHHHHEYLNEYSNQDRSSSNLRGFSQTDPGSRLDEIGTYYEQMIARLKDDW
eukprot:334369_1